MTQPLIFHPLAEEELREATSYYYAQDRLGLGEGFVTEVERVLGLLSATPMAGSVVGKNVRQWRLRRFPYTIVYKLRSDHIQLLALAAHKRRPSYWLGRA